MPGPIIVKADGLCAPDSELSPRTMQMVSRWKHIWDTGESVSLSLQEEVTPLVEYTWGSGRLVLGSGGQADSLIARAEFISHPVLNRVIENCLSKERAVVHLLGGCGDLEGQVKLAHLFALIQLLHEKKVERVVVHLICWTDENGASARDNVKKLIAFAQDLGIRMNFTLHGRHFALDEDGVFDRIQLSYHAIVSGDSSETFTDPMVHLQASYQSGQVDEMLRPSVQDGYRGINDGDAVIVFHGGLFIGVLIQALTDLEFTGFSRKRVPTLSGMTCFSDESESGKIPVAFPFPEIVHPLGEVLRQSKQSPWVVGTRSSVEGLKRALGLPSEESAWCAETEVPALAERTTVGVLDWVDHFLPQLQERPDDSIWVGIDDLKWATHQLPYRGWADAMAGVDLALEKLFEAARDQRRLLLVTSTVDVVHSIQQPVDLLTDNASHHSVPLCLHNFSGKGRYFFSDAGRLPDFAPTVLDLMRVDIPAEMTGRSLLDSGRSQGP